ncbi:glycogenin-2 isoform X3 [Scophthalmus maximus]|uniref:glycogenin glucosyltransferase n=1 Tax=Scophthalmus maximus TaxID=52904 RepID=A0A8D3AAJ0_SCOMX|nr:glycogenin-2 isoform X3 [Scophthalmus maximus]
MTPGEAFVTLATTDSYCMGASVVARSLRRHGTTRSIVVMVTPNVSERSRLGLGSVFDEVVIVDATDSEDRLHLSLLGRPELGITFTKIHCWTLTQYSKCVFLDADTLVLSGVDELFERDELSAAPDAGWPDCFNSGVFVFRPSLRTHARLLDRALQHGSFDGGDQGLLNSFFSDWPLADATKRLPFIYNLSASSVYSYLPAFRQFGHQAKIVHFLGPKKPWLSRSQRDDGGSRTMDRFVALWWKEYLSHTTASASAEEPTRDCEEPRQVYGSRPMAPALKAIQEQGAKTPFSDNSDSSSSQLAGSPAAAGEPLSPLEPELCFHADDARFEDGSVGRESTGVQASPLDGEGSGGSASAADPGAADREPGQRERRRLWEDGRADYLGQDAFQNIQKILDCFLD